MKRVTAARDDILVLVDELGWPSTFPPEALAEVQGILTLAYPEPLRAAVPVGGSRKS